MNELQFNERIPDLIQRLNRLYAIKPKQFHLQLLSISAQLGRENVPLALKLLLIGIFYFQILQILFSFNNVFALIYLRKQRLIK